MDRLSELEDRVSYLESSRSERVATSDSLSSNTIRFGASSYYVDIEVDIMSTGAVTFDIALNGVSQTYTGNFVNIRMNAKKVNTMTFFLRSGGILSKRIRIEGIGVRLLNS